jgi:hypothetical protein
MEAGSWAGRSRFVHQSEHWSLGVFTRLVHLDPSFCFFLSVFNTPGHDRQLARSFLLLWFLVAPPEKVSTCHKPPVSILCAHANLPFSANTRASGRLMSASPSSKPHYLDHIFPFPCTLGGLYATRLSFVVCVYAGCAAIAEFFLFFSFYGIFPPRKHHLFWFAALSPFSFSRKSRKEVEHNFVRTD